MKSAPYRWTITKDRLADEEEPEGTCCNAKGMSGPYNASDDVTDNATHFSMYDDDGNCYYEGTIYGDFEGFEPLEDFGMPNAGCTAMKLNGDWL